MSASDPVTASGFRVNFPEFANRVRYPDSAVNFWLPLGYGFVNPQRWGLKIDLGAQLWAAHWLVLERKAQDEANFGGVPGTNTGAVNSKSVDKVSLGYDSAGASEEGAGHWNLTTYGTRFIALGKLLGAGPVQVTDGAYLGPDGYGFGGWGPWGN